MDIRDQIVLITGGARGVGAAAARAFAGQGARVVINWRASGEQAQGLATELGERVIAIQADVTDRAALDSRTWSSDAVPWPPSDLDHDGEHERAPSAGGAA